MIKFGCELLEDKLIFETGDIKVLEINNKKLFGELLYKLNKSINTDEILEGIILLEDDKEISFKKDAMIIYDFYNFDINQTKIIKSLYEEISKEYKFIYDDSMILSLQKELLGSIREVLVEYDYEFSQKEILDIKDILKIMDVKFDTNFYDKPLDVILFIFDMIENFKICKLLILVNAKCYFNSNELEEIYKMARYRGIRLMLVEYYSSLDKINGESKIHIDEDYDEFYID